MKAIGGYFGFENFEMPTPSFHDNFYRFNTCRNALVCLLNALDVKIIHIPVYSCGVIADTLLLHGITPEFYTIDENLIPDESSFKPDDYILYINYFGLMDKTVFDLSSRYSNLIVDNAQAFYSQPVNGVHTVYSPRKFFGMPDGGQLSTTLDVNLDQLETDTSENRCLHLQLRKDFGPEKGYPAFVANEKSLGSMPIRKMSNLSRNILSQVDHSLVKARRKENYLALEEHLENWNQFNVEMLESCTPFVYPFLVERGNELKKWLIERHIFIPTYWPEILKNSNPISTEYRLVNDLVSIPIDHRYGISDMKIIIKLIEEWRST